jgi:hypothetical protein
MKSLHIRSIEVRTMGCCGKNRPDLQREDGAIRQPTVSVHRTPDFHYFEYVGRTSLTALGPITGRHYRFERSGARIAIDARDAPSMIGVPNLRKVHLSEETRSNGVEPR